MNNSRHLSTLFAAFIVTWIAGCAGSEIRPVELYPEDACASCRMAVSDPAFASEIITMDDEVLKFDDLRCMENYRRDHATMQIKAIFVKDYGTRQWLPYEKSVIVRTGIDTPMGSGKIAAASADEAKRLTEEHPPTPDKDACCSDCEMK